MPRGEPMTRKGTDLEVTYSSGVIVEESDVLATLAVFYDRIWLPYPWDLDPDLNTRISYERAFWAGDAIERYLDWRKRWELLFNEGILQVLPHPSQARPDGSYDKSVVPTQYWSGPGDPAKDEELMARVSGFYPDDEDPSAVYKFEDLSAVYKFENPSAEYEFVAKTVLAFHAVYSPKIGPELFLPNAADLRTERLAGFLVQSFFKYRVPKLQALQPDEILEVRAALSDTKQGFTDFIFELTDDLEQRLKDGTATEIEAATKIVERKLAPKYDEFLRQLRSRKAGFWSRVLTAGGKFFQINASPLTPKFYAGLFEAVFSSFSEQAAVDWRSNASQAFQYVARLNSLTNKPIRQRKPIR